VCLSDFFFCHILEEKQFSTFCRVSVVSVFVWKPITPCVDDAQSKRDETVLLCSTLLLSTFFVRFSSLRLVSSALVPVVVPFDGVRACVLHEIHMSSPAVVRAGALFRSLSVLCVSPVPILFVLLLLLLLFFFVRTLHVVSQRE